MPRSRKKYLILADCGTVLNSVNGDRTFAVTSGRKIICSKDLVGVYTQQIATAQNIVFSNTFEIDRQLYNDEKYCYQNGNVYEIKGLSKAKSGNHLLLNVVKVENEDVKNAIESWKAQ